ncbi:MAG TPA: hypothetical protein VM802_23540, partial [Chitinophaga sp.]|uniref:right-handed parallel beta-helix repeat-containing protein n=1 Tax=Chitinophaga sp. TaxID=1869181 RepID=UPI002B8F9FC9
MKKYTALFRITWMSVMLLMLALRLSAQTDIKIGNDVSGNSSTGYPCPLQDYYEGNRSQYLIRASELTAAGMGPGAITAIRFLVKNLNTTTTIELYGIKIGTTADTALKGDSWVPVTTNVYGPLDYQPVTGLNSFNLSSPMFWNGVDNIVVEVCSGATNTNTGDLYSNNPEVPYTTGLSFNASHTYRRDNEDNLCGTVNTDNTGSMNTRPNIVFAWTPAAACTGTPAAGTATANPTAVCLNGNFTVTLSGTTVASGLTYQWQRSSDNATWTDINGETSSQLSSTQSATSYYRCKVTCTGSGSSAFSTSAVVTSPTLVSGTFTINKALPTGSGNFASFNDAYNFIKCGITGAVVFNVTAGSGPYNEQLVLAPVPGASGTNTITFNGNGDTLRFPCTSANRAVIQLNGADNFTFKNLVIKPVLSGATTYGWGVHLLNDADSNTISNCTILLDTTSNSSTNHAGIVVSSSTSSPTGTGNAKCDYNTFDGNTINGGYYGVVMAGSIDFANGNNKIINNKIQNFYSYGIHINGSFKTLIENNQINRPTRSNLTTFYGIYFTGLSTSANITRNRITNPFGGASTKTDGSYGIYFTNTDAISQFQNVVSNNVISDFSGKGDAYGIYNSSSDNNWYLHNTIVLDGSATTSTSYTTRGFTVSSKADGVEFVNNLISVTRGGGGTKYAIYFGATNGTIHANRNDYYLSVPSGTAYVGYFGANNSSLLDWQTASKQDTNSLASNPLFVSASTGNYQPNNASIDNKGEPVGITVDINNVARNASTPDIGAYEFTPGPCTTPPVAGTAHVSTTPICVNRKVALSLSGNSVGLGQTYQWQTSATAAGPYTNLGTVLTNPDTVITSTTTLYYRAAVTCTGNTTYSDPVLLTVNPALPGGIYTINKAQPTSGGNYNSFNAAKAAMECGISGAVTFNVVANSGPYNEQLVLDSIAGTSSINTITFNGNGNTIKFASTDANERAVIKLRSTDFVTFDSLTIDARGGSYGYGVHIWNNADSNKINRCTVLLDNTSSYSDFSGIVINGTDGDPDDGSSNYSEGNIISNNKITGGYFGVNIYTGYNTEVGNNSIIGNTIKDSYSSGIQLNNAVNTLVDHNDISRPTRTDEPYQLYGIGIGSKSNGVVISSNRIHNLFGGNFTSTTTVNVISHSSADGANDNPSRVFNNLIYDIRSNGDIYGLYNSSSDYIHYYHNTVVLNDDKNTIDVETGGYYNSSFGTVEGNRVFNNIFDISRSGPGSRYGLYVPSNGAFASDYNDIYVKSSVNKAYTGSKGANYTTLAAWRAGTKLDSNSLDIQPVFADPVAGNFA